MIRFGTDGWRALVAEEFTFPNVRRVVQGIALYLRRHPVRGRSQTVIVGYDTRPLGDRFAQAAAEVLAGNGLRVLVTPGPVPTPAVSMAVPRLKLLGAVLITASHNPFTYNGVKFRPFYAGSADSSMTQWIERRISQEVRRIPFEEGIRTGRIRPTDLAPHYIRFLRRYVQWDAFRRMKRKRLLVAYDCMHGAGQDFPWRIVPEKLGNRVCIFPVASRECCPDPIRSAYRPEPIGEHLKELASEVRFARADAGLATDGDADRMGLIGPDGRFVSSQETMALLLWHLLEDRGWRGPVVTTVAATNLMDALSARYGIPLERTPVGFKHIVERMRKQEILFGGEESGGFCFRGTVPERDGLLAGLLILELMAVRGKSLSVILGDLRRRFGRWIYRRADLELGRPLERDRLLRWAKTGARRIAHLREIQILDGVKMILKDGSWLLLRPSGTEPLLRVYAEARSEEKLRALLSLGRRVGGGIL